MDGITVTMAIVDFIPVVMFFAAAIILQRALYNKMVKGAFALLASGSILVLAGGAYKALWKILYALSICDYPLLNNSFFPMQGLGFVLVFLSLAGMFTRFNKTGTGLSFAAIPVFDSSMPFVVFQVLGCAGTQVMLFIMALKMKKAVAAVLFVIAFVAMLGMGYLSAKFDDTSSMHWIAQCVNIISNGALLAGVVVLDKAGLGYQDVFVKKAAANA